MIVLRFVKKKGKLNFDVATLLVRASMTSSQGQHIFLFISKDTDQGIGIKNTFLKFQTDVV